MYLYLMLSQVQHKYSKCDWGQSLPAVNHQPEIHSRWPAFVQCIQISKQRSLGTYPNSLATSSTPIAAAPVPQSESACVGGVPLSKQKQPALAASTRLATAWIRVTGGQRRHRSRAAICCTKKQIQIHVLLGRLIIRSLNNPMSSP